MKKIQIKTDKAPQAIGPYSQGISVNGFIFVSGQLPINPKTGEMLTGDIKAQTKQIMENIKEICQSQGLSLDNIVKTTIFLKNLNDFADVNEIYGSFFKDIPPARSTIQVAKLPKDADIEIEAIAFAE